MDRLLYWLAQALLWGLQRLSLPTVARWGRAGGALVYGLDARHRRVARENIQRVFQSEKSPQEMRQLARENFRRIGENFACAARTALMDTRQIEPHLDLPAPEKMQAVLDHTRGRGCVVALGHFGNFELFARLRLPGFRHASTYRGLRQPGLNRLLQSLRERSGCQFFDRRTEAPALRAAMSRDRVMLGLLVDQHAGDHGLPVPFFGIACSTSVAPAVFALRYHCPLYTAVCYRTGLARWRIELGDAIPTHAQGTPRSTFDIMRDVNQAFEMAIRRDPANWFWVHRRWKLNSQRAVRPPHE